MIPSTRKTDVVGKQRYRLRPEFVRPRAADLKVLDEVERPRTRGDCLEGGLNAVRPCPFVSCKHHLFLDVDPHTGRLRLNFPDRDVDQVEATCALDLAERDGMTLVEIGDALNLTHERVRQIEADALGWLKHALEAGGGH